MKYIIRPITSGDEYFLSEMLYQAIHIPKGKSPLPREIVYCAELAGYVQSWGSGGDCSFFAINANANQSIGAIWLRLLVGENKGYGYVDDNTPEMSIAILPEYRGQGIGTQLLTHLFTLDCGKSSVSLSVSANNLAIRLYERFGFKVVSRSDDSLTMKRY